MVSIIMPAFNSERFIGDAIQSILDQDHRPIQVVLVDNGSTDSTISIVRSFNNVSCIVQPEYYNIPMARNVGLVLAKGEFIAFLDSDDIWLPGKLSAQVKHLRDNPELAMNLCRYNIRIEEGVTPPYGFWDDRNDDLKASTIPSALVARRETFLKVGAYDITFDQAEDSDWFLRAHEMGMKVELIPELLMVKRYHENNITHRTQEGRHFLIRALKHALNRKRAHVQQLITHGNANTSMKPRFSNM